MRELAIQAEVGRRLRNAIGRTHAGHALRVNSTSNNAETVRMVEELIDSGVFSSADKSGLLAMKAATVKSLHDQFVGNDEDETPEEVSTDEADTDLAEVINSRMSHEALMDFAHAHRPKAMRRDLPEQRAQRNGHKTAPARITSNKTDDAIAMGMVPPKMNFRRT